MQPTRGAKKGKAESSPAYKELMERCREALDNDTPIRTMLAGLPPDVDPTPVKVREFFWRRF
jgi:hypothetical protein